MPSNVAKLRAIWVDLGEAIDAAEAAPHAPASPPVAPPIAPLPASPAKVVAIGGTPRQVNVTGHPKERVDPSAVAAALGATKLLATPPAAADVTQPAGDDEPSACPDCKAPMTGGWDYKARLFAECGSRVFVASKSREPTYRTQECRVRQLTSQVATLTKERDEARDGAKLLESQNAVLSERNATTAEDAMYLTNTLTAQLSAAQQRAEAAEAKLRKIADWMGEAKGRLHGLVSYVDCIMGAGNLAKDCHHKIVEFVDGVRKTMPSMKPAPPAPAPDVPS